MRRLLIFLLATCFTLQVSGATFYVSTNGLASNPGTLASPWNLATAQASSPSNTLIVLRGTYPSIVISKSGQRWLSLEQWGAKVVGSPGNHGISTTGSGTISNVTVCGFEVSTSAIDGIKINGPFCRAVSNWVHGAFGQGFAAHNYNGTELAFNLIEYNGTDPRHDHGVYVSGTNLSLHGNVLRYNKDYGLQAYDDFGDVVESDFYSNLIYGNGGGMVLYTRSSSTNRITGNTIIATNTSIPIAGGAPSIVNNILICGTSYLPIDTNNATPSTVYADYNLVSKVGNPHGTHDVIASDRSALFVSTNAGLYWLKVSSPARNVAKVSAFGPVDFFNAPQISVNDVGFIQYTAALVGDTRVLDPSPSSGANYWGAVKPPPVTNLRITSLF